MRNYFDKKEALCTSPRIAKMSQLIPGHLLYKIKMGGSTYLENRRKYVRNNLFEKSKMNFEQEEDVSAVGASYITVLLDWV